MLLLGFMVMLNTSLFAQQNFSVKLIATVQPPNSPYLADYTYAQSLNLNIILGGRTFYQGILKIRLESMDGRGIVIQTRATYNPIVDLGPSQTLTGVELAPYFSQENLDFIGFDRQQYLRTKRIPDGIYRLTFSFYDRFRPDVLVSNVDILSQKILRVFALQPPLINLPLHMGTVNSANQSAQPVNINWTRPANTPFTPEYEMIINELRPECQSSYNGINTGNAAASRISQAELFNCLGPEIYRTTTTSLSYSYGMQAEPLLGLGKWYSIRIQARDPQGRTLFINNGISQIRVFRYGKPCDPPPRVRVKALNPYQVQLDWDALSTHTSYTVHFKKAEEEGQQRNEWYQQRAISNRAQINDLEPGTYYSFRVSADCNAFSSEQGATTDLLMPRPAPSQVQCGKELVVDLSNNNPIQSLQVGQKIMAGDFEFTLTEVRPLGGGWFAGKAYTQMKLFQGARVAARFDRIKINTDRRLIDGELISTGAGVQIVPDEWREKYLSFTNEINRIFEEIDKGLDRIDAVMGKIDEVLKKIDEWLENYQGEDKAELLETIRIGKKEIEEGKEAIDKKDLTNGLKKLKDGSSKVLGVGAKMVKKALETLFKDLKDLLKEVLDQMKGGSKQKKDSLLALEKKNEVDYKRLRAEVVNENQKYTLVTGRSTNGKAENSSSNATTEVSDKLFPTAKYASMDSTTNGAKFDQLVGKMLSLYQGIDWENIRFDQIEAYLQDPAKFTVLLESIKTSLEALGKDIADDLLKNNVTVIKGKIKTQVKKVIDDLVKEFYDKETKK
ncbi:hypothetical protein BKI52_19295 [marine bacterium AO1-C]|nr:hypothetical protein BKI52_19295 [marine bacterium AO1-C]